MAIYHCSLRIFSRAEGHSAVAAAAYRAGTVLKDRRTGKIHRYGKRKGVLDAFILAPSSAPQNLLDRAELWNAAEGAETRKNSRVAREIILALPHELAPARREALCRDMALWLVSRYGVAVDTAIHSPVQGDGHDGRNHHAHLLFTTRELGPEGLGKKTRILDDKEKGPKEIELIREVWETLANDALQQAGLEGVKIDRRTLEEQGIDRVPQTHVGKAANHAGEERADKLKSHFAARSEGQAEGEDGGDEESEGSGKTGKTGKAGSGDKTLALKSETKEDRKGRTIDYKVIDQNRTRLDFNEEIKKLNERRAAFADIPIEEQIAHVEKLTGLLESRQDHLKTLLSKSTLPRLLIKKIETIVTSFKETLFIRDRYKSEFRFTAAEKEFRDERQAARYGRLYRAGLHEQIREMKANLDRLEQKQREYQSFKSFIDKIEDEIKKQPQVVFEQSVKASPPKAITNEEYSLKLNLKAQMLRDFIPAEFKPDQKPEPPTVKTEFKTGQPSPTLYLKDQKPSVGQQTPKIINPQPEHPAAFNSKTIIEKPAQERATQTLVLNFQAKVAVPAAPKPDKPVTPDWKQPMPVRIAALDKAIQERQGKSITVPDIQSPKTTAEPSERKNWFIPATEKTQPLQKLIDKTIAENKKAETKASPVREQFRKPQAPPEPVAKTTNEKEIEKVKQEAQEARNRVPPQYRAEPYEEQPKHKPESVIEENSFKAEFATEAKDKPPSAEEAPHEIKQPEIPEETPKPRMSKNFNAASFNGVEPPAPETPEEDFNEEASPDL